MALWKQQQTANSPWNPGQVQAVFRVGDFRTRHNESSGQVADVCVVQHSAALGREGEREGKESVNE
jgi:hypothetical protein